MVKLVVENKSPLQSIGGGGANGGMSEVDAKIAAAEARTDTKFAELLGELKLINAKMGHLETTTNGTKMTVIVTAIAALGLTVAIMAYGGQWFSVGMDAQKVSQDAVEKMTPPINAMNAHYDALNKRVETLTADTNEKFDALLKAVQDNLPKEKPLPSPFYQMPTKQ
ncbi:MULTISPECIES: hypothetical protein [Rhizobium]|uniref:Uncharacterized protein n=1 Tax=Rhizobium rhododendri TaxID=2506430 RepID=A0ABY8IL77_9HYPH|nr:MULTISPECIES: hypothetical protein [Rhizobium]MBZ5758351.1 hypothetical protein [Rhizobium sp. VS19-DR96]MBZ5764819.1 hypothetical protein [Rhizobium sp. VS19-DR129.2]MBZ5772362.1 hypothetical protein [Rhizobium sp. VS19-DRK62.2]MBZ5782951.1 hypothetical protein [Rhizobium sp. VS19-DR121]MBZ5800399.1 hypothetical protein [Rhizobium sp. VS19-DR181]